MELYKCSFEIRFYVSENHARAFTLSRFICVNTGCRKTMTLQLGNSSFEAEADRVHSMLQHWANQSQKYVRQRHHVAFNVDVHSMPSEDLLRVQAIQHGPRARVRSDFELDGIAEDGDMTGTTDSGGLMQ